MRELSVIALLVAVLAGLSLAPTAALLYGGAGLAALGLGVGLPAGFSYHLRLFRILRARGLLVPWWWVSPLRLHSRLDERERQSFSAPFRWGAVGFVVTVLGCVAVSVSLVRQLASLAGR